MSFTSTKFSGLVTCRCLYGFTTRSYVNVEMKEEKQEDEEGRRGWRNTRQTNAFNHKGKRRNPISRRSRIYREGKVGWRNRILVNWMRLHRKQHDDRRKKKMHRAIPEDRKRDRPLRDSLIECSSPYVIESKVTCRVSSMLSNLFRVMKRKVIAYSTWDSNAKTRRTVSSSISL